MSEIKGNNEKSERFANSKGSRLKEILTKFGALLGLIGLSIILASLSPRFLTIRNIMNIANQASITCLISLGMLVSILTSGIDLSVGSILALSSCVMGIAIVNWHLNPFLGVMMGIGVGAGFGFLNGILLTKLRLPHPFISTMGTQNVARGLALVITAAAPISGFSKGVQYLGAGSIGIIPVSIIVVIVCSILFNLFLNRTTQGRHIYAVGGNREAAKLSGINVDNTLILVYTLSGLMCAVAGLVLIGRVNSAAPLAGLEYANDAIAACIIGGASFFGGTGTVGGTLIGAFIMAILRNGLNLLGVSSDMQTVAIGAVIIGAVYVDVLRSGFLKRVKVRVSKTIKIQSK